MSKTQKVFSFLVVLPLVLFYLYNSLFEYSGNWLEDYQSIFKFGFLLTSIVGDLWLIGATIKVKTTARYLWLFLEAVLLVLLIIYTYLGLTIVGFNP